MNAIIAGKSGTFGPERERRAERLVAPFAVYTIEGGCCWARLFQTAEAAIRDGKAFAAYKGWEFQDRTEESA